MHILYLCRNASPAEWQDAKLNLFCRKIEIEQQWWLEQQSLMQYVDGRLFLQEYACLVSSPVTQKDRLKKEIMVIRQRLAAQEIPVVPPIPDAKYWHRHYAAVMASDALTPARVLPPFRSTATLVDATWGGAECERQSVARAPMSCRNPIACSTLTSGCHLGANSTLLIHSSASITTNHYCQFIANCSFTMGDSHGGRGSSRHACGGTPWWSGSETKRAPATFGSSNSGVSLQD